MLAIFDKWGVRYPVTVMQLDHCQVVQVKSDERNGYTSLQIGIGEAKLKRVNKPLLGHFTHQIGAQGIPEKDVVVNRKLVEFKVNEFVFFRSK